MQKVITIHERQVLFSEGDSIANCHRGPSYTRSALTYGEAPLMCSLEIFFCSKSF